MLMNKIRFPEGMKRSYKDEKSYQELQTKIWYVHENDKCVYQGTKRECREYVSSKYSLLETIQKNIKVLGFKKQ